MKLFSVIVFLFVSLGVFSQEEMSHEDSLENVQFITTIEQSLDYFYAEYSPEGNYDSIIDVLNYEQDSVPVFSDSIYCARLSEMNEMSPFHLDCNEQTLKTIKFFARKRRGFTRVVLGRSKLYFDLFEAKLSEHNMPIELKYLAVIESGLRPQVKSRAGALGLWQFMYATGRMYGLTQNSYIDERMDPEMATDAACRYLKKLHDIYGDWNLALAAYNAGPGNVNKAIRRSGNKLTYWEVRPYLPRETQGYVPNFIAAAYLLTYHAEHNIIPMEAPIRYIQLDTMCFNKGVHFSSMAQVIDMELEEIERLNPIYKKQYLPKTVEGSCITLPMPKIGLLIEKQDSLFVIETKDYVGSRSSKTSVAKSTTNSSSKSFQYHKVRSGETLATIAKKYKTTVSTIQRMNSLQSTKIYVGQRLKVKKGAPTTSTRTTPTPSGGKKYYSVRKGDTFGKIAQRYRLSQSQLKRLNPRINISRLSIGQKIRVK